MISSPEASALRHYFLFNTRVFSCLSFFEWMDACRWIFRYIWTCTKPTLLHADAPIWKGLLRIWWSIADGHTRGEKKYSNPLINVDYSPIGRQKKPCTMQWKQLRTAILPLSSEHMIAVRSKRLVSHGVHMHIRLTPLTISLSCIFSHQTEIENVRWTKKN